MSRVCRPGEGPPNVPRVRSAQDAGRAIYTTFGEVPEHVESTAWGDYFVVSKGQRGQTVRIVQAQRSQATHIEYRNFSDRRAASAHDSQPIQRREEMRQGEGQFPQRSMITAMRQPAWGSAPSIILNDAAPTRKPQFVTPEMATEALALKRLDDLETTLIELDSDFTAVLVPIDREIRKRLNARVKTRRDEARAEFDKLTGEGRKALERLTALQAERSARQDDLNRAVMIRNTASQKYQSVRRTKPSDSSFPTRTEYDTWERRMDEAKAAFDAAEGEADALRSEMRARAAAISLCKAELAELRARRESARKRAGIKPAGESQDVTAESLSVQG